MAFSVAGPRTATSRAIARHGTRDHDPSRRGEASLGPWEFHTDKWELAYIRRIDATIAALKSAGVPVIWVGLPSQRSSRTSANSAYLNELYRSRGREGWHRLCGRLGRLC